VPESAELRERVIAALKTVRDPELPVNIYDLGLIYGLDISPDGAVDIRMTLTTPACPVAGQLPGQVQARVEGVAGVRAVQVQLVWEPPWTRERMSAAVKLALNLEDGAGARGSFVAADRLLRRKPERE
jgi:FeS assembly SUF system protein